MKTTDRMRSYAVTFLKLCFAALIIYYMVATGKLDLPRSPDPPQEDHDLQGRSHSPYGRRAHHHALVLPAPLAGHHHDFKAVLRINCIGMFFNSFMPGALGGDLVKAFYIAKDNKARKVGAVMTILIDRIVGFQAVMIVAFVALFFNHKVMMSNPQLQALAFAIAFYIACSFVAAACVFSKRVKRLFIAIGVKKLVYRLPKKEFLLNIYNAFHIYAHQKTRLLKAIASPSLSTSSTSTCSTSSAGEWVRMWLP